MELWVRSQNKEYLIDARELAYGENFRVPCVLAFIRNTSRILGRYHTKERALEVLDEIQKRITMLALFAMSKDRLTESAIKEIRDDSLIVYEMPEE